MMIFEVEWDNYDNCRTAIKDILWMYQDLVLNYSGFGHNIDFESIDYMKYFFSYTENEQQLGHISNLLSQGSLVALCCEAVNLLDEESRSSAFQNNVEKLLNYKIIEGMPFERNLLESLAKALKEDENIFWQQMSFGSAFDKVLSEVYDRYVIGYYKLMGSEGKSETT